MIKRMSMIIVASFVASIATISLAAASTATLTPGEKIIKSGDLAEFPLQSSPDTSTELSAWCEISTGGRASVMFDGEHYVPLSDPSVGDNIMLSPGESRRYELTGTVAANRGDAYIGFLFVDVPAAMCFPGMQCDGASAGAVEVKVACGNN
jgi:hypothetical protein